MQSEKQLIQSLAKERERNTYLQNELSRRDRCISPRSESDDADNLAYITELEN